MILLHDDRPAEAAPRGEAGQPHDDAIGTSRRKTGDAEHGVTDAEEAIFDIADFRAIAIFAGIRREPSSGRR